MVKGEAPVDEEFSALIQDQNQGEGDPYEFDLGTQVELSGCRTSEQRPHTVG